jgi:hypothetical protein
MIQEHLKVIVLRLAQIRNTHGAVESLHHAGDLGTIISFTSLSNNTSTKKKQ